MCPSKTVHRNQEHGRPPTKKGNSGTKKDIQMKRDQSWFAEPEKNIGEICSPEKIPADANKINARKYPQLTKAHLWPRRECWTLRSGMSRIRTTKGKSSNTPTRVTLQYTQMDRSRAGKQADGDSWSIATDALSSERPEFKHVPQLHLAWTWKSKQALEPYTG